jgi:hypothetical protein
MSSGINLSLLIGETVPVQAPLPLVNAIQSVEVTNTDEGRDGFQITINVGRSGGPVEIIDYSLVENPLLRPFSRVIIAVLFGLIPKVLIDGFITHKQLRPSNEPGKSTLLVTGEDLSIAMDLDEKSETHPNQSDTVIVTKIILSYGTYGLVPVVIPPASMDVPTSVNRIPSQQGTDLSYIRDLAGIYDYIFYIEPTSIPGINNAYWGPLPLTSIPQKALSFDMGSETNLTSINFEYNALTPNIVTGSVQDSLTNIRIPVITFGSLRPPLSSKPAILSQSKIKKKQFRASGLNFLQAYVKAQSETDKSMDVLKVTGELDSMRYGDILRARKLVGLRGVGYSHDGFYYVKSVNHTIMQGEYKQSFTLTREGSGSSTPVVPV